MFGRGWVVERSHDAKIQFHLNGARLLPGDLKFKCFAEGITSTYMSSGPCLMISEVWAFFLGIASYMSTTKSSFDVKLR